MPSSTLTLRATPAFAGAAIKGALFGPVAYVSYGGILLVWITYAASSGAALSGFILPVSLIAFALSVLHDFVTEKLPGETADCAREDPSCLLSFRMVDLLSRRGECTAYDLVDCALLSERGRFVLKEMGTDRTTVLVGLSDYLKASSPHDLLADAAELLPTLGEGRIDANAIILAVFLADGEPHAVLNALDLSREDMPHIMKWEAYHHAMTRKQGVLSPEGLLRMLGAFGRTWVMGYTDALEHFTVDVSARCMRSGGKKPLLHDTAMQRITDVLAKPSANNVLLLGEAGSGRKTLIERLAYLLRKAEIERNLPLTRVLSLDTQMLLSGTDRPDALLLHALDKAGSKERFVFVITDIGMLLRTGDDKLKAVLAKYFSLPAVRIIGIGTPGDYHAYVKHDPALDAHCEKVFLDDPGDEEVMRVLMHAYFSMEKKTHVHCTYKALKALIELSRRYLTKGAMPGKALDVLREALALAGRVEDGLVTEAHVREVLSKKANIDISALTEGEREKLLHLHEAFDREIVGQKQAVHALISSLKRARLDIDTGSRPLGTFLFLGPTGVGKTKTAKVLAETYFGSEDAMIRLDMNEYGTEDAVSSVVGSTNGSSGNGYLTERVQDRPFSLILLDEIEKAHPRVLNLFLQILDEGTLTDARGSKTDFRNTMIIATSNAGALAIRGAIAEGRNVADDAYKKELLDAIIAERTFVPEFLNRFDGVCVFAPLTKEESRRVAQLMIADIAKDLREKRGIELSVDDDTVRRIAEKGYSADFGARAMRRAVVDVIENYLADHLLKHEVKRGDTLRIDAASLGL